MRKLHLLFFVIFAFALAVNAQTSRSTKPNVIFILADDLGYADLGAYGQKLIHTPHLDRLAKEGMRFTQFYAGSTVCAPSRAVLMTGKHTGHTSVRGNGGAALQTLRQDEKTVAQVFKDVGYRTALFGKWGLGEIGTDGHPNRKGFDEFFGFLNQGHAHNYFPSWLIHNSEKYPLRNVAASEDAKVGSGWAREKIDYAPDVIFDKAMQWLDQNHQQPFFLYFATTLPHANNEAARGVGNGQEIPDYGDYKNKSWPDPDKGQAAMVSHLDKQIGQILAKLKAYGIDRNTLVIFTSDNGPHQEGKNNLEFFDANGPLRGMKRALYEGGIRVPFIARWPGQIKAGTTNNHIGYFGDVFATVCELTKQAAPSGLDSLSFVPALRGKKAAQHNYLYFEFYEQGGRQAVRFGKWKAIREPMLTGAIQLFDLSNDIGETNNLAAQHPEIVEQAVAYLNEAHVNDPNWQVRK